MNQKRRARLFFALLGVLVFVGTASKPVAAAEAPAPRAPLVTRITSVEQLVPFGKILLRRDVPAAIQLQLTPAKITSLAYPTSIAFNPLEA